MVLKNLLGDGEFFYKYKSTDHRGTTKSSHVQQRRGAVTNVDIELLQNKDDMRNFITENFRKSRNDAGKNVSFEAQIKRDEDDVCLSPTDAYGILRFRNVCDISYAGPKYLRFAPTKKCCEKLRELLLNKWYFKSPNLLALTYGTTSFDNKSIKKIVSFVNKAKGWFISTDEFNDDVPYHCLVDKKKNQIADDNLIMLQHWKSLQDDGRYDARGIYQVNEAAYEYKDKNKRAAATQHSVFLFLDFLTGEGKDPGLRSQLKLIENFSKSFNGDSHHKEYTKKYAFNVAPVVLFWEDDQDALKYSVKKKNTLMALLTSNLPLVIGGTLAKLDLDTFDDSISPAYIMELKKGLKSKNVIRYVESDSVGETVVQLLVDSRHEGLPPGLQQEHHEMVSAIYHSMSFGLEEFCRKHIEDIPVQEVGVRESLTSYVMSMLLYYQEYDLLEYCFYCGYDIETFVNFAYASKMNYHDYQSELAIIDRFTKGIVSFFTKNEEWCMYLKFCCDEKWDVARILRRHLPNPIMKCLMAIQIAKYILEERRSNPLLGQHHYKQIQQVINDIEDEAKELISICNIQQFDLNLILYKRYSEFCNNTILSIAVENDCKKLFMVETNVDISITNRWNGKAESDHHIRLKNPVALFLKDKEESELVSEEGWYARAKHLLNLPRIKCCNIMLVYIAFIAVMAIILLESKRTITALDCIAVLFVISFIFVEISQMMTSKKNTVLTRIQYYFKSVYNIVDLVSALSVIVYLIVKSSNKESDGAINDLAQFLMSVAFLGYIIRFTQFLQMYETLGPKLNIIKCLLSDLIFFLCFLLLSMISYGIVSEYLLSPSPTNNPLALIPGALFRPYYNTFGVLDLGRLEADITKGVCVYEYNLTGVNNTEEFCASYNCNESTRCSSHRVIAMCLLVLYMIVTGIILLNLLLAIFCKTYEDNELNTYSTWQMQRYTLITEFETQFFLPFPPFNIGYAIWIIYTTAHHTPECFDYYSEHIDNFERRANNIYHKK